MLHGVKRGDVRSLHRTRVASRRLREVLPVLQLDGDVAHKLGKRLRRVTDKLGAVRELDVLLLAIDELSRSGKFSTRLLSRVAAPITEERDRARARLSGKLPATDLRRLAAKLDKVAAELQTKDAGTQRGRTAARDSRWAIEARVARRASALHAAIAEAGAVYLPERLHEVRIAVKKLRYALELLADLAGAKAAPDLPRLRQTQEYLGRLHDLQVLLDRVRQVQASLTPPDITMWRELDTLVTSLENQCRRLHARYMRDRDAMTALTTRLSGRAQQLPRAAGRRAVARHAS